MGASRRAGFWLVGIYAIVAAGGCAHFHKPIAVSPDVPRERQKVLLPEYVLESPDLLQIDLLYAVPRPPYKIQPLDVLAITVANTLLAEPPINGLYPVEPDGTVVFGGRYKSVKVAGLTTIEARAVIQKHLEAIQDNPKDPPKVTTVAIAEGRGVQLVRGQHLIRPDGTVSLGSYGSVVVAGYTVREAKALIEEQLKKYLVDPEV